MILTLFTLLLGSPAHAGEADEEPKHCGSCEDWNLPRAPFPLTTTSWYVGTDALASIVVKTDAGAVLLDAALPQSGPQLVQNLASIGLAPTDLRYILVSHPHFDHVGGLARMQRLSGATVVRTPAAAEALRAGTALPPDPQAGGVAGSMDFPPVVGTLQTLNDGESLTVGATRFTLHATPGHTPGGATWTWESCEGSRCVSTVFGDSLNPVSAPGFRFSADPTAVSAFRRSIESVAELECDVFVPVHPSFGRVFQAARRAGTQGTGAFIDPQACRRYAADAARRLHKRLRTEAKTGPSD